jgi:hypothetical protein
MKTGDFIKVGAVILALLAGNGCDKHQSSNIQNNRYTALGVVMAAKLNEMSGGKGSIVLVVGESDNNQPTPVGQAIAAYRNALGKLIQISATETVTMPAVLMPGFEPLPAGKFAELLQKYSSADYLVSFVGVPLLTSAQIAQLPSPRPQVVEVIAYNAPTKAMFAGKVLSLAAVFKPGDQAAAVGGSAQEIFDDQYQLVTPATAGGLPR